MLAESYGARIIVTTHALRQACLRFQVPPDQAEAWIIDQALAPERSLIVRGRQSLTLATREAGLVIKQEAQAGSPLWIVITVLDQERITRKAFQAQRAQQKRLGYYRLVTYNDGSIHVVPGLWKMFPACGAPGSPVRYWIQQGPFPAQVCPHCRMQARRWSEQHMHAVHSISS
jgi:hypothetical protein